MVWSQPLQIGKKFTFAVGHQRLEVVYVRLGEPEGLQILEAVGEPAENGELALLSMKVLRFLYCGFGYKMF